MRVSLDRFEAAVLEALGTIPAEFQPYLEDIEFVVAARSADGALGHYDGATALERGGLPPRVTVYKDAHEVQCESWTALVTEVRRTVLHEVGHHFGMDEDDLPY